MPNLNTMKRINGSFTNGEARKYNSDLIMEATWDEDIATRTCYFYDWYRDKNKTVLNNLDSPNDPYKIPMRVKYIVHASQTMDKDAVTYHLQLKPSQENVVPYYDEFFTNRYHSTYPCGLYVDIPDYRGIYNRWMIVAEANYNDPQFPTFELLRCDKVMQYVFNNTKYYVPGVLRSQNSYNSGIWTDYKTTSVEDQQKFIVPMNRDTEHIFYNQRMIIDAPVLTEPRTWKISKINRLNSNGLCLCTLAQDHFDQHKDYIEVDSNNNVIGMWADYYSTSIPPQDIEEPSSEIYAKISYSGKPQLKVGGSFKKIYCNFYENDEVIDFPIGTWSFESEGSDVSALVDVDNSSSEPNLIRVKFIGDDMWIGKTITIKYVSEDGIEASSDFEIIGL